MDDSDSSQDSERLAFRKQLSELSFEQLIKLKEKIGAKVYKEGIKGNAAKPKVTFGRSNKNRPREVSSKIPVEPIRTLLPIPKKQDAPRDPRFDSTCGEFDEKIFKKSYSFIKDIQKKEKKKLYAELKKETDEERISEIKYLIQRLENKEREEKRKLFKEEAEKAERLTRKQAVKDGKKPFFYKKSEKKMIDLVDNYESLKKSGKLKKHIERKIKKEKAKGKKINF
ncbi:ribosomal RNA processing protein 36 homolog isoform X2 [Lycorma delicatula]|uniref:ribosomal RNA processing protein 36 homolog isoform X2 n=1 Tax=Lycorma delicatula TaxID=130591 RepID=UPI003F51920B